jgi:hypothetical protein
MRGHTLWVKLFDKLSATGCHGTYACSLQVGASDELVTLFEVLQWYSYVPIIFLTIGTSALSKHGIFNSSTPLRPLVRLVARSLTNARITFNAPPCCRLSIESAEMTKKMLK